MRWNHLIFEAYCCRKWNISKSKYFYEIIGTDPLKTKKKTNPYYDPNYKTPRKPSFCENEISYTCYEKQCPHLVMSPVDKEDYDIMLKAWFNEIDKHKGDYQITVYEGIAEEALTCTECEKKIAKGNIYYEGYVGNQQIDLCERCANPIPRIKNCPVCGKETDFCPEGHSLCFSCGWQTENCNYAKEKSK